QPRRSAPSRRHWEPDRAARRTSSVQPVDDPPSLQIVRGQLDSNAVAEQHPDPEPLHPAGRVPDHLVPVVQPDAEHAVAKRLDDLALELDLLLFLSHTGTRAPKSGKVWRESEIREKRPDAPSWSGTNGEGATARTGPALGSVTLPASEPCAASR